jgi:hypothetical protein
VVVRWSALCGVERPARRHGLRADGVEAGGRHLRDVALDDVGAMVPAAIGVGAEGPVRDAADVEDLIAAVEEFAPA